MSAAVFEYLATSSMARLRPKMPAPEPPTSSGRHRPSSPASRKTAKMSSGYSPELSMARARGLTLSWANRRTEACKAESSGDSSKSMAGRLLRRRPPRFERGAGTGQVGQAVADGHGRQLFDRH